jgi:hypothetical protein
MIALEYLRRTGEIESAMDQGSVTFGGVECDRHTINVNTIIRRVNILYVQNKGRHYEASLQREPY